MKRILDIDLSGLNILVVEDDPVSALLISSVLSKHGASVDKATNGHAGLEKFNQKRFPIIVTDINMPGMNGLELVSEIKALDQNVQFIATSANRDAECLVTAIELGFSDYFLKPVEIEKLILAVKRCGDVIAAKKQLEDEQGKFYAVVESLGEGIIIKDLDYQILYQNSAMTKIFGDRVGTSCYELFELNTPCQDCPTIKAMQDGRVHSFCRGFQRNGVAFYIESTVSLLRDSQGAATGAVEIIRDITDRINNEKTIRDMAFHDQLTGLANRRLFEDRLQQTLAKSLRYGMKFGLFYLDLDHFKDINDTFGHEAGDVVLVEAAERIKSCCKRNVDTISRQGGDEFCIIITNCGEQIHLEKIAEKLLKSFSIPFRVGSADVTVTTSIGISIFPNDGTDPKSLETAADKAMYYAKRSGRNTHTFFDSLA